MAEVALAGERPSVESVRAALGGLTGQDRGDAIDMIVNACTHFPLLEKELVAATGGTIRFVDGGPGIARRVAHLTEGQSWPEAPMPGRAVFTARNARTERLAPALARFGLVEVETL
jgi:glutamate racemase